MPPLTLVEEVVLLALDDRTGALRPMPLRAFDLALAGAVLADLALRGRIDTDPGQLTVLRAEPTGDPLLDPALEVLAKAGAPAPVAEWLNVLSQRHAALESAALDRLVARGMLRREDRKLLWIFGARRYPTADGTERAEVRARLSALILGDDLPDPVDAILISLLRASHLTATLFSGAEFRARAARVENLAKMDLVGREVAAAIDSIGLAVATMSPPPM